MWKKWVVISWTMILYVCTVCALSTLYCNDCRDYCLWYHKIEMHLNAWIGYQKYIQVLISCQLPIYATVWALCCLLWWLWEFKDKGNVTIAVQERKEIQARVNYLWVDIDSYTVQHSNKNLGTRIHTALMHCYIYCRHVSPQLGLLDKVSSIQPSNYMHIGVRT